jgi:hypothetical protein
MTADGRAEPQPSNDWLAEQLARFTPEDCRRAGELLRTLAALPVVTLPE